jgi:hypothetical protein
MFVTPSDILTANVDSRDAAYALLIDHPHIMQAYVMNRQLGATSLLKQNWA